MFIFFFLSKTLILQKSLDHSNLLSMIHLFLKSLSQSLILTPKSALNCVKVLCSFSNVQCFMPCLYFQSDD